MLFVTTVQEAAPERRPPLPERGHTEHQAAALWLSKAITLADVNKRPWLRDLVRHIFNGPQQRMVRGSPNTKKSTALPGPNGQPVDAPGHIADVTSHLAIPNSGVRRYAAALQSL